MDIELSYFYISRYSVFVKYEMIKKRLSLIILTEYNQGFQDFEHAVLPFLMKCTGNPLHFLEPESLYLVFHR